MRGPLKPERRLARKSRWQLFLGGISLALLAMVPRTLAAAQDTGQVHSPGTSIKVDVGLVDLNVTVNDRTGQPFTALKAENFRVYDDGIEQMIHHFNTEDRPYSMGLVLDRSGSMFMMMEEVYQAAFHTIRSSKAEDEFFISTFNEQSKMQQHLTTDRLVLEQQLKNIEAGGATALYDAILDAVDHIQQGSQEKKALLVVTDGADNASTHRFQEVLERARQESVAIYVVGMFDKRSMSTEGAEEKILKGLLTQVAEATGGKAYFPRTIKECERACIAIAQELRQQYSLGYYPSFQARDGSWHNVQVKLQLQKGLDDLGLGVRTRAGYYAPQK